VKRPLYSNLIARALQRAAEAHRDQTRKGTHVPYIAHPVMVGLLLQRAGFDEETVAAGILHDVHEDAGVSLGDIGSEFGPKVAELVAWLSEKKSDAQGRLRPWEVRKREHQEAMERAPTEAKAIALADQLHNLQATLEDQRSGQPVWARFRAPRERWLWNAACMIEACNGPDRRLRRLAAACRKALTALEQESG
jgi:(p)ppGpp synthase/HD superfamily hydrolase